MKKIALFILFSVLLPLTTAHAQQKNVTMQPYYGSGDLATHMQKEIDDRIANTLAGATTKSLWYTRGSDTGKWEQNPNVFIYSGTRAVNLNGQSPWNSQGKYARSGTLISPRHIIFAKHFPFSASTTIVFIAPDNSVVSRKIEKVEFATSTSIDIGVALLDRDVPESIPFYPIVPSNVWQQYLSTAANADIPIIYLDQEDKVGVQNVKANAFYNNSVNMSHVKGAGKRAEFDEPIIVGDSGNPAFAVVGGQPVLEQQDPVLDQQLFKARSLRQERGDLIGLGIAHHLFDSGAVVPAAIEQHDLSARREVRDITLEVPLTTFGFRGFLQSHHTRTTWIQVLHKPFDGAPLARRIPPFKNNHDFLPGFLHPSLQLKQFDLQLILGGFVILTQHKILVRVATGTPIV